MTRDIVFAAILQRASAVRMISFNLQADVKVSVPSDLYSLLYISDLVYLRRNNRILVERFYE